MNFNFAILMPELVATAILVVLILKEALIPRTHNKSGFTFQLLGIVPILLSLTALMGQEQAAFSGMFILDPFAVFFKIFFTLTLGVVIIMARHFFRDRPEKPAEFFLILWTALIGLFFLVSANDFLLLFISLEILTLSSYILTAYLKRDSISIEAGIKYLIMGSLASAFLIYGISLLYMTAGSTSLVAVRDLLSSGNGGPLFKLGWLLVLSGLGFKIAAVPFQLWVPDVYQGAPTPVGGFLAVASKSAGFAVLMRLLFTVFFPFDHERVLLFSALAAMTLLYGNLGALVQTNIKRLFGYSSIGHAGYLLIGIAAGKEFGVGAVIYYLIAYAFSNLTAWFVINYAGKALGSDRIESYRGLAHRSPFLAGCFFVALLSLAGVPPLAGFFGKFLVLLAAVQSGLTWLALLGAVGVVVSLYYYLMIVRMMYIEEPSDESLILVSPSSKVILFTLVLGIFIAGIWQAPFLKAAALAAGSLF